MDKVSDVAQYWLQLIHESIPSESAKNLAAIIEINKKGMKEFENFNISLTSAMDYTNLTKFMKKEQYWKIPSPENVKRQDFLRRMLEFRSRQHIELLDFTIIRKYVNIKNLLLIFSKCYFVNFTVQESSVNSLLVLQGYFLKNFIYFHLRHDMRFKASIDSFMIEMDNPYTRQAIRDENRKDPILSKSYLDRSNLNLEDFCKNLLENFFPNISGIWADQNHMAPAIILQLVRVSLEYGMISPAVARQMIPLLMKVTLSLQKLEEGWAERPDEKSFSIHIKLHSITNIFAKCREHMSMIIIEILILLKDDMFMTRFPHFVQNKTTDEKIQKELFENFTFFDKEINDTVLFITMNYLSNIVTIKDHKSTNDFCKESIEKIFQFLTTASRDCFLNSLKQINGQDLKYIEKTDVISKLDRETADTMGITIKYLLEMVGNGRFEAGSGKLADSLTSDKGFEIHIRKFQNSSSDKSGSLDSILKSMTKEMIEYMELHEDYKVALVKESVPLKLVALIHYCSDGYFDRAVYRSISKECFKLIRMICTNNNFCKSQLFKGECLFHFRKLLANFDQDSFAFLHWFCSEENAAVFLGREVFAYFLTLFIKFSNKLCQSLDLNNPDESLNIENAAILILMTRYLIKLFSKNFLSASEKLQNLLQTQESLFINFNTKYIPILLKLIHEFKTKPGNKFPDTLTNEYFMEGCEDDLLDSITQKKLDPISVKILLAHVCFTQMRLYNILCADCTSSMQQTMALPLISQMEKLINVNGGQNNQENWMIPVGFEAAVLGLIKNFKVLPQQNIIIENKMDVDFNISEASFSDRKKLLSEQIRKMENFKLELESKMKGNSSNQSVVSEHRKVSEQLTALQLESRSVQYTELDIILRVCKRMKGFIELEGPVADFQRSRYLYEGFLPIVMKYLSCISLTVLNTSKKVRVAYSKIEILVKILSLYHADINQMADKEILFDFESLEFTKIYLDQITIEGPKKGEQNQVSAILSEQKKEEIIKRTLDYVKLYVKSLYEGTNYKYIVKTKRDLSKQKFTESFYSSRRDDNEKENEDIKKRILDAYIKNYQELKDSYLEREEEPNLIGFFDRNTQNLRGVFNSCLDRLLSRSKLEKNQKKHYIAHNVSLSKFWVSPSCVTYVNMVTMLLAKSKSARKELYDFIKETKEITEDLDGDDDDQNELESLPGQGKKESNVEKNEVVQKISTAVEFGRIQEYNDNAYDDDRIDPMNMVDFGKESDSGNASENRDMIFTVLLRIQADLIFYLNSNSDRNSIWWITHQTYEMISTFFKNLCECNFMPFKDYLGKNAPRPVDKNWTNFSRKTYTEVFSEEFKFIMKTTKMAQNRDPVLISSDYSERVQPILLPLVNIMNEATIGPCSLNQKIFIETDIASLCSIATRILDDLNSDYFELANLSLSLISALIEGFDTAITTKIANRLPATIIADRIQRLMKKLYVLMLIEDGDFKDQLKKLSTKAVTDEKTKPPSKNQVLPLSEKNYREIPQEEEEISKIITEDMEKEAAIEHWDDLLEFYMEKGTFSGSQIFTFIFRLFVIWKTLAVESKNHHSRLEEAKYESDFYFEQSTFLFIKTRSKGKKKGDSALNDTPSEMASIYYFLANKILLQVEILDPKSKSVVLNFPRMPQCFMLSDEAKKNYRNECDISDSNTKMVDLLRNFDLFSIQMEGNFKSSRRLGLLYPIVSTDAFFYYTYFCWIFGFALNVLMLVGYEHIDDGERFEPKSTQVKTAMKSVSWILMGISSLLLVLWLLTKYSQTYKTRMEDYKFEHPGQSRPSLKVKLYVAIFRSYIFQSFPMSYSLHVLFTLLGLFVDEVFFVFNLFLIINISNTARFVLQSIMLHWDQLLLTLMLSMFVIFCYTILAMEYLYSQINLESTNTICDELYRCFFYVLNTGLRNGGGWAESLTDIDKDSKFPGRTIYDMTFFMLITVISLNIIFGIIIDTFSQLRDAQYERRKILLCQ